MTIDTVENPEWYAKIAKNVEKNAVEVAPVLTATSSEWQKRRGKMAIAIIEMMGSKHFPETPEKRHVVETAEAIARGETAPKYMRDIPHQGLSLLQMSLHGDGDHESSIIAAWLEPIRYSFSGFSMTASGPDPQALSQAWAKVARALQAIAA